ncbi:MAG TPA: acyl-ACP--UDP-N-acetylglucosamine O-acyltransferase [Fimbriimonadaceae bacterium]|nr:acyl-ACP--UDP-N-acetylglucosamine O-acyltransferase [Fimbriimonadaceae bacterium]
MANVHPLAFVHPKAELAEDVRVGPFCFVEEGVVIGSGCRLDSHATVKTGTTIGANNVVGAGAVLGGDPQDRKYQGEPTFLQIGDDNVFREYVTVHRATGEGHYTRVGSDCYIMAYCHLGHNVTVHDHVTIANSAGISGHVTIEELVTIGGMVGIHQYVRVGRASMVGGFTKLTRDVPPFCVVEGVDEQVRDINAVGLRRIGIAAPDRLALHKAVKLIFRSQLGMANAIETVRRELPATQEIVYLIAFLERLRRGKNGRGDQP